MSEDTLRLLLVEDCEEDVRNCQAAVRRFKDEKQRDIDLIICRTLDEGLNKVDNYFDGAIVDLRLNGGGSEGNEIIRKIKESYFRIPVAILTGTPANADADDTYLGIFMKGETSYMELFNQLSGIYDTGLTRILGGRGRIEETLNQVFRECLLRKGCLKKWVEYGKDNPEQTEKALLRHTVNHLMHLLDDDTDLFKPEEVYIFPPLQEGIRTGGIVRSRKGESYFVILNPACDLVVRKNGSFKTDCILVAEVKKKEIVAGIVLKDIVKPDRRKVKIGELLKNNYTNYYHWLPPTDFFEGGFLDFRHIATVSPEVFGQEFEKPHIQISSPFVKDIIARFSSYYARQGQPEIENSLFVERLAQSN